ncbi:hypothetical protein HY498_05065 [Candidatus Woesearchaeota archaeon]|nr:hypothetical protein [Candidatus Woesearchaeota archaeon]
MEKEYKYDVVKLIKQLCKNPLEFSDFIGKLAVYIRHTGKTKTFSLKSEITNPFDDKETIFAEFKFKTSNSSNAKVLSPNRNLSKSSNEDSSPSGR